MIVSQRIIMSIIVYNTNRLLYKDAPRLSNRHVQRLFTCSNSPNIDARTSAIFVATSKQVLLKPYECLQMVMSATVPPKSRTYPHFRDLDNNQIEELSPKVLMFLFLLVLDVLRIIKCLTLSVCSQPWRQWKRVEWFVDLQCQTTRSILAYLDIF